MTLKEAAEDAEIDPKAASKRKGLFAAVEIPYGKPVYVMDGDRPTKKRPVRVRYLSRSDTLAIVK